MKFFNRDLSWLSFNYRVLMEAGDETVPLLERLRFLAIYSSNLDEFFRVRVADIRNFARIDKKKINKRLDFDPMTLLPKIHEEVVRQLDQYGKTFQQIIKAFNNKNHVICTSLDQIPGELKPRLLHFFKTKVLAFITPLSLQENKALFLDDQAIYLIVKTRKGTCAIINIPSTEIGRFYTVSLLGTHYFIFLDDVIRLHLDILFPHAEIEECYSIKLNKDADLHIDDEYEGDLVKKIEKQIQKRNLGTPARFLFDQAMSTTLLKKVTEKLGLSPEDIISGARYHNLNDLFEIEVDDASMKYDPLPPIAVQTLENTRSLLKKIEEKDLLLHFPYQPYDYVLQFFNEAAIDEEVCAINVTFYRMAKKSLIGEALISAAKNGKSVTVFMEVKARFDEANNLEWARRMKAAGVKIIYSLPGLKVHAKVALIKKKNRMYGFFGTGNLNEKTAEIYCDHGLFTTHEQMTRELSQVFEYLVTKNTPPPFSYLIVSHFGALDRFTAMIDKEISHAEAGRDARIIVKVNNLQEESLIRKLYEAVDKGVDVKLIVRSICCAVPGKKLKIKRIVDRFLEHGRVFYFHNDGAHDLYLGSADWMNRNLYRRIEVCFPVLYDEMKQELLTILKYQWRDGEKGVWLTNNMQNKRPKPINHIRAQRETYHFIKDQYG